MEYLRDTCFYCNSCRTLYKYQSLNIILLTQDLQIRYFKKFFIIFDNLKITFDLMTQTEA